MDQIITSLLTVLSGGGPQAIIALLVLLLVLLIWERRRMHAEIDKKDEKLDRIIDEYHKGNLTLAEALNSLKIVLFEIKAKL